MVRKDSVFRLRMPGSVVSALKRVARARGQPASEYVRGLIAEQVRRDEAAGRVRAALRKATPGKLDDAAAMALADEARHAGRGR